MLEGQFVYQPQNPIIQKTLSLRKTRQSFPLEKKRYVSEKIVLLMRSQ